MARMFYCSMHMPIGWEYLSMATDRFSVCMAIIIINSKLRGAKEDIVAYMVKTIQYIHINNVDPAIKFTVESNQQDGATPFLDTIVKPEADNSLSLTA